VSFIPSLPRFAKQWSLDTCLFFERSSQSNVSLTERLPVVITLDNASQIIVLAVFPNDSEDLNYSEKIWVDDTLNDFMAGFHTGAPPLNDAQEDVSPVIQEEPVQLRFLV
jgi:hypothetical protein